MTPEEIKTFRDINDRWLSGEFVEGLAFLHNSTVEATLPDGQKKVGSIVCVSIDNGIVTYTVESGDGSGDYECEENTLRNIDA